MTATRRLPLAFALVALLAGCAPTAPEPAPTAVAVGGPATCALADGTTVTIELPAGFEESAQCVWTEGETYLSVTSTIDDDLTDIHDQADEAEGWIGIGGDEDVSDFAFDEGVDLFAAQQGDVLAYRSAADGVPIVVIVGQSADLQLSYSTSADETDVASSVATSVSSAEVEYDNCRSVHRRSAARAARPRAPRGLRDLPCHRPSACRNSCS